MKRWLSYRREEGTFPMGRGERNPLMKRFDYVALVAIRNPLAL